MKQANRALLATLVVVALGATIETTARAAGAPDDASRVAVPNADKKEGIVLDHFMIEEDNPNLIIPCIRVLRKHWNKAQHGKPLTVVLDVSWESGGETVSRTYAIPLTDFHLSDHHGQPGGPWLLLDGAIDISDAPLDEGSSIDGDVALVDGRPLPSRFDRLTTR